MFFTKKNKDIIELKNYIYKLKDKLYLIDTDTLMILYISMINELYSREDFASIEDLKISSSVINKELIKRGVICLN